MRYVEFLKQLESTMAILRLKLPRSGAGLSYIYPDCLEVWVGFLKHSYVDENFLALSTKLSSAVFDYAD